MEHEGISGVIFLMFPCIRKTCTSCYSSHNPTYSNIVKLFHLYIPNPPDPLVSINRSLLKRNVLPSPWHVPCDVHLDSVGLSLLNWKRMRMNIIMTEENGFTEHWKSISESLGRSGITFTPLHISLLGTWIRGYYKTTGQIRLPWAWCYIVVSYR